MAKNNKFTSFKNDQHIFEGWRKYTQPQEEVEVLSEQLLMEDNRGWNEIRMSTIEDAAEYAEEELDFIGGVDETDIEEVYAKLKELRGKYIRKDGVVRAAIYPFLEAYYAEEGTEFIDVVKGEDFFGLEHGSGPAIEKAINDVVDEVARQIQSAHIGTPAPIEDFSFQNAGALKFWNKDSKLITPHFNREEFNTVLRQNMDRYQDDPDYYERGPDFIRAQAIAKLDDKVKYFQVGPIPKDWKKLHQSWLEKKAERAIDKLRDWLPGVGPEERTHDNIGQGDVPLSDDVPRDEEGDADTGTLIPTAIDWWKKKAAGLPYPGLVNEGAEDMPASSGEPIYKVVDTAPGFCELGTMNFVDGITGKGFTCSPDAGDVDPRPDPPKPAPGPEPEPEPKPEPDPEPDPGPQPDPKDAARWYKRIAAMINAHDADVRKVHGWWYDVDSFAEELGLSTPKLMPSRIGWSAQRDFTGANWPVAARAKQYDNFQEMYNLIKTELDASADDKDSDPPSVPESDPAPEPVKEQISNLIKEAFLKDSPESKIATSVTKNLMKYDYFKDLALTSAGKKSIIVKEQKVSDEYKHLLGMDEATVDKHLQSLKSRLENSKNKMSKDERHAVAQQWSRLSKYKKWIPGLLGPKGNKKLQYLTAKWRFPEAYGIKFGSPDHLAAKKARKDYFEKKIR